MAAGILSFSWAEVIDWTAYHPSLIPNISNLHVRSITVGEAYSDLVLGDGEMLVSGRIGIGTPAPVNLLEIVGLNDGESQIVFMPGDDTPDSGVPGLRVGIGTADPQALLDVVNDGGTLRVPRKSTSGDPAGINGMIYYNSAAGRFRSFENGQWKDFGGAAAGAGVETNSYTGNGGTRSVPVPFAPRAVVIWSVSPSPGYYIGKFSTLAGATAQISPGSSIAMGNAVALTGSGFNASGSASESGREYHFVAFP